MTWVKAITYYAIKLIIAVVVADIVESEIWELETQRIEVSWSPCKLLFPNSMNKIEFSVNPSLLWDLILAVKTGNWLESLEMFHIYHDL